MQPRRVLAPRRLREIRKRDGIEVVVRQRDEAEAATAQIHDFLDDAIDLTLSRLLTIGPPHRTERAVLRAAAYGLHRRPHVPPRGQQIPARRSERLAGDPTRVVDPLRRVVQAVGNDRAPDQVTVALDDGMRASELVRFLGIERRVDAAKDDRGAGVAGLTADFVSAQGVTSMDADPDHVARTDVRRVEGVERFVTDDRIPVLAGRGRRQNVQPARGDDRHSERQVARIDQVNAHARILALCDRS